MGASDVTSADAAIEVSAVAKHHRNGFTLGPISLTVPTGSCFGLIGHNGAGKSTLLRLILGIGKPTSGMVSVFGAPVVYGVPSPRVTGIIEEPRFFGGLTAEANLRMFATREQLAGQAVASVLERVGLGPVAKPVRQFSQGMRQRLGIARALLREPRLLVLDEPANGLDPVGIAWLRELVREQVDAGCTVVLSSHLLHEVQAVSDGYAMLTNGRLIASGSTADLDGVRSLEDLYFELTRG